MRNYFILKQENQLNNLENINNNINIINNTNYINNLYQFNFGDISKDICLNNEQVVDSLRYFNLSPSISDSEEDLDNISIIKNRGVNDFIFLEKIIYIKDIIGCYNH